MTKKERILKNIAANKEIQKDIRKAFSYGNSEETFIEHAQAYIKAIKDGRMICNIASVSKSGMSRTIKFLSCEKNTGGSRPYWWRNYFGLFKAMGYSEARSKDHYFSISGCGMDMIFHTNYTIIHRLHRLGFISKAECDRLAQDTPTVI